MDYKFKTIADLIADLETHSNPSGVRFEPALYARYEAMQDVPARTILRGIETVIARFNACSIPTANMIAATSWGEWQLLGVNVYDPAAGNFQGSIASYLANVEAQRDTFVRFITKRSLVYSLDLMRNDPALVRSFAEKYNGPGNVDDYAAKITARLNAFA